MKQKQIMPLNKKLVLFAFSFSFAAMALSFIAPDGWNEINKRPNFISVLDLAEKIKNRKDIRLIDLRDEEDYLQFHLPSAENLKSKEFPSRIENQTGITVFYSGDDHLATKLWLSLEGQSQKNAFILYGGAHGWYERILYPKIPENRVKEDVLLIQKIISLSKFYGGSIEFSSDPHLLDFYRLDLNKSVQKIIGHHKKLHRKGC